MAKKKDTEKSNLFKDKSMQKSITGINSILSKLNLSLYGTDRTSDVDKLNDEFQKILKSELDSINNGNDGDITSFLMNLYSLDKKSTAIDEADFNKIMNISQNDLSTLEAFMDEAYKNKLLEYHDLEEVSSKLIELNRAIDIMKNAIISSDVIEGRMNRNITFDHIDVELVEDAIPIIETMENKLHIRETLKKFVIPKALNLGEYYLHIDPYSRIFNDFIKDKGTMQRRNGMTYNESSSYVTESTIFEYVTKEKLPTKFSFGKKKENNFYESTYNSYMERYDEDIDKNEFINALKGITQNITVCNDFVPLPVIEEGIDSMTEFMTEFVSESGDKFVTEEEANTKPKNLFDSINDVNDGANITNGKKPGNKYGDFSEIKDCYIKPISPMNLIPIKIMDIEIGYYYMQVTDIDVVTDAARLVHGSMMEETMKKDTVINAIVNKIVSAFDKKFLLENTKFKELIVNAINYYNLNEKKIRFQFIPAEYIVPFKVDVDEDGHGTSMISGSLFYAKLYLMLLLFKYMSIILYSNDERVNYVATSGISKNIANKVEEIIRIKQSRQINMMDLFSLTSLINKVGSGNEQYIPVGRGNERKPIETEVISGQSIDLDTPFMEELKKSYILATPVPAAMVNYLSEAEFAKQVEQNHSKFTGAIVDYQLDLNDPITKVYQKCAKWSTNLDENLISSLRVSLKPPKSVAINTKSEEITQATGLADAVAQLIYDEPGSEGSDPNLPKYIRNFKKIIIRDQLPFLDFDKLEKFAEKAELDTKMEELKPNPNNGDDGDDIGIDDDLGGL